MYKDNGIERVRDLKLGNNDSNLHFKTARRFGYLLKNVRNLFPKN